MGGFLKFEKMITPIFIQILFWVGFLGSILMGFIMIGYGIISENGGMLEIFSGLFTLFLGPIIIRVYCEIMIVVFKMQGALISIRNILNEQHNVATPPPPPTTFEQDTFQPPTDEIGG